MFFVRAQDRGRIPHFLSFGVFVPDVLFDVQKALAEVAIANAGGYDILIICLTAR